MDAELASWLAAPEGHLSIEGSRTAILLLAAVPLALALLAIGSWLRWGFKRRAALRAAAREPAAGPGLVTGVAEVDGEGPAVRLEIEQTATEYRHDRFGRQLRWREVSRRVVPRPFRLRLATGGVLPVEPDQHALVVTNELAGTTRLEPKHRLRFGELAAGETLTVRGTIVAEPVAGEGLGYREAAPARAHDLVLRPPRNQPMMIILGPAGQQTAKRARAHLGGAVLMVLGLLVSQLINVSYHLRRCSGHDTVGAVLRFEKRKAFGSESKTPTTYVWVAIARHGYSRPVELDFSIGDDTLRKLQVGTKVPVRFVPSSPWASELGSGASLWSGRLIPGFLILILPVIGYLSLVARSRREPATLSRLEEIEPDRHEDTAA